MKKTTMKLVFFILSFVAFATTPVFSQTYVSKDKAVSLIAEYQASAPITPHAAASAQSQSSLNTIRHAYSDRVLKNLKEGMSVSAALTEVKDRFASMPSGPRRTSILAVQQELQDLLTI